MQQDSAEPQALEASEELWENTSSLPEPEEPGAEVPEEAEQTWFHCHCEDSMAMYADIQTVANHFNHHQLWFTRCALPMKAQPIGENGYDLLIGRFGSFGYLVEARIGLELLPPDAEGLYRIRTIAIPGYTPPGYDVNFQSIMELVEVPAEAFVAELPPSERAQYPSTITSTQWKLDLAVGLYFPKFIHRALSKSMIQKTGDSLLNKIVSQVNRRLTYKTQLTFHESLGIPFPKNIHKK